MGTLAPLDIPPANLVFAEAAYSANYLDTVIASTAGGAFTVTLPDATQAPGRAVAVFLQVKGSGDDLTISASESQDINGSSGSLSLSSANTGYTLLSLGASGWIALSGLLAQ
jgi:hypothetical protein